ncbi:hypothetical protein A6R68_01466 [Neotoma lepida]|uniref:Uncharacterized protein n=1 Tax=Neotoma lepida TaxID=56216 RepID=A0A1A6GUI3_NEOLE|nr:hypothetical protein A6R68_01466 [Neotoma lepida]
MLHNPSPDYITTLHCTQEAVYPLYTIVLVYYAFCLVFMLLLRPLLVNKIQRSRYMPNPLESFYAALYFFPVLTLLQAIAGGLLYYAFPYIVLVASLANLIVHWFLHGYGLIALFREDQFEQDLNFLILVPVPVLFYFFTNEFTKPSRIISEGAK